MSELPTTDGYWEPHVNSAAFDQECAASSWEIHKHLASGASDSDYSSYGMNLFEKDTSIESSPYDVSNFEAHLYYFGTRGPSRWGPKLIFRTSKDVFPAYESGPEHDVRLMRLLPVYEHQELGKDNLWAMIRSKVVELLDQKDIQHSSIDLVRFRWVEDDEEIEDYEESDEIEDRAGDVETRDPENEYDDFELVTPCGTVVTTPVTIWVGVLPDTLTSEVAFHSSNDILNLLKEHGISDVEVAYRESVVRNFSGPELFAPASDYDPLKAVIDPVTTALGLPIAGLKTLKRQGTMGFFFRVGEALYGVTTRHVLFPEDEGNNLYSYVTGRPKKKVVLMGSNAFNHFLLSIKSHIDVLNKTVGILERQVTALTARSEGGSSIADKLMKTHRKLSETRTAIPELKKFFVQMKTRWTKPKDRVIGHVVWSPPVAFATAPHGYTKDVCVIKLDENKFSKNFGGNVLDLGPEIDAGKFRGLLYPEFEYPLERLLELRGILSPEELRTPSNKNRNGDHIRYVIKRSHTTLTTFGCLNGFESNVRRYFGLGSHDSVEAAVYAYDGNSGPFSKVGDSGSIMVDPFGKFAALLTGGTGPTDSCDITYGSPMYWLWEVIEAQFPGASLYFGDKDT